MMNSSADDFGDNPFRSLGTDEDLFFDATPTPAPTMQQQQSPPLTQQQQPMMAPMSHGDPFAPQPAVGGMPPMSNNFPPPTGPMQTMAPQPTMMQQQPQQQQQQVPQAPQQPTSWWGNLMMCITLDSYKAYFDIDAEDIVARVKAVALHFYKPEYFRNNVLGVQKTDTLKGPDLYGPFWITMTLIFFIAVRTRLVVYKRVEHTDTACTAP